MLVEPVKASPRVRNIVWFQVGRASNGVRPASFVESYERSWQDAEARARSDDP